MWRYSRDLNGEVFSWKDYAWVGRSAVGVLCVAWNDDGVVIWGPWYECERVR